MTRSKSNFYDSPVSGAAAAKKVLLTLTVSKFSSWDDVIFLSGIFRESSLGRHQQQPEKFVSIYFALAPPLTSEVRGSERARG